ncbi:MAG: hypothetical protein ACREQP_02900 [Candidatus Binatia bacterium]
MKIYQDRRTKRSVFQKAERGVYDGVLAPGVSRRSERIAMREGHE